MCFYLKQDPDPGSGFFLNSDLQDPAENGPDPQPYVKSHRQLISSYLPSFPRTRLGTLIVHASVAQTITMLRRIKTSYCLQVKFNLSSYNIFLVIYFYWVRTCLLDDYRSFQLLLMISRKKVFINVLSFTKLIKIQERGIEHVSVNLKQGGGSGPFSAGSGKFRIKKNGSGSYLH